jgi:hypothetical protein
MISLLQTLKDKLTIGGVQKPSTPEQTSGVMYAPVGTMVATKGKWVSVQGRVGIISEVSSSDTVTVAYVDPENGTTTEFARVSIGLCAVASFRQIPACRRGDMTVEAAAGLGYF